MEYRETITITKEECEQIDRYLTVVPTCEDDALHSGDYTYCYTVCFSNGFKMEVCCIGDYGLFGDDKAYTESILYDDEWEELWTYYGDDTFLGEWSMEYEGNTYTAVVVVA